jgi:hypothetical protein
MPTTLCALGLARIGRIADASSTKIPGQTAEQFRNTALAVGTMQPRPYTAAQMAARPRDADFSPTKRRPGAPAVAENLLFNVNRLAHVGHAITSIRDNVLAPAPAMFVSHTAALIHRGQDIQTVVINQLHVTWNSSLSKWRKRTDSKLFSDPLRVASQSRATSLLLFPFFLIFYVPPLAPPTTDAVRSEFSG